MIVRALKGVHTPPWLVGLIRGIVEAAVLAALNALALWLTAGDGVPTWILPFNVVLIAVIRQTESLGDQKIDPAHNRYKRDAGTRQP